MENEMAMALMSAAGILSISAIICTFTICRTIIILLEERFRIR